MLAKIAWRNIWRSKTRSLVVIGSVVLGVWSLIFMLGFFKGQVNNYVDNIIANSTSHIQIHDSLFINDKEVRLFMPDAHQIAETLRKNPQIQAVTERILVNGMLGSSATAQGVMVKGIAPDQEDPVTHLGEKILEGGLFEEDKRNQIIISRRMADKLKVKLRSKVVFTFQNVEGDISTAALRVVGIYKTANRVNDELFAYAQKTDMERLTALPHNGAHELAILVNDIDSTGIIADEIKGTVRPWKVQTYKEISPDLDLFDAQMKLNNIIMTVIFMLALIFGIINTMLMAVLERIKELGMLMAIGMNKIRVFFMVVLETLFVALIGAPLGMLLGYVTIRSLHETGINLSRWSAALEEFGMHYIVRPEIGNDVFVTIALSVLITAVLASIYPALRAVKLKPVEALRKL